MPVVCYQVEALEVEADTDAVVIRTHSRTVPNTNFEELLRLVAPTAEALGPTLDLFSPGYRYLIRPPDLPAVRALADAHAAPVVTAVTDCALSVCLDWYQHPDDAIPPNWTRTEVGALVYRAKYYRTDVKARTQAGMALAKKVIDYVKAHPVLRTASGIAPMPSSQFIGPAKPGLVRGVATLLARELGIPLVDLERVSETPVAQKNLTKADDPDANQVGTMKCDLGEADRLLLVDDLMRHGSTVNEAARAVLAAGAAQVFSLTLAKERTGTKGYYFS